MLLTAMSGMSESAKIDPYDADRPELSSDSAASRLRGQHPSQCSGY